MMSESSPYRATDLSHGISLMRLELFVRNPTRSLRFYEEVLGFVINAAAKHPTENYIPIVNGHVRLALASANQLSGSHYFQPTTGVRLGVGVEIVLEVENLAEYEARAQKAHAVREPTQLRPWGMWDFRVVDPDGYYIRVTEALNTKPKAIACVTQS
jgi:predicted enzyme related to lactoylglutathione lyase